MELPKFLHRVKHIPTGLYYQPGPFNLSEKGKMYTSNNDVLSFSGKNVTLRVTKSRKTYNKYKDILDPMMVKGYYYGEYLIHANAEDFEREYINQ